MKKNSEKQKTTIPDLSPKVEVSKLLFSGRTTWVVREDLLIGGTKQRAIAPYLSELSALGYNHFIYASPFAGFAQVALAYVCEKLSMKCTIFAEIDPKTKALHEFTSLAKKYGAHIVATNNLCSAEQMSKNFLRKNDLFYKIPLGFDSPEYKNLMLKQVQDQWLNLKETLPRLPKNLWISVGSGVLAQIFSKILDENIHLNGLDVHVLKPDDERISCLKKNPRFTLFSSDLEFCDPAHLRPNIPSNLYYDAKIWKLITEHGEDGDVWWNVAR